MEIGGAKFDIDVSSEPAGNRESSSLSLTVVIFGIASIATVRRVWEDTSSVLRDINPELEEVPTGETLRSGPPSTSSLPSTGTKRETKKRGNIQGVKFNLGKLENRPPSADTPFHVLKVTVFGMDTMATVELASEGISEILCTIDPKLELRDARGDGLTLN